MAYKVVAVIKYKERFEFFLLLSLDSYNHLSVYNRTDLIKFYKSVNIIMNIKINFDETRIFVNPEVPRYELGPIKLEFQYINNKNTSKSMVLKDLYTYLYDTSRVGLYMNKYSLEYYLNLDWNYVYNKNIIKDKCREILLDRADISYYPNIGNYDFIAKKQYKAKNTDSIYKVILDWYTRKQNNCEGNLQTIFGVALRYTDDELLDLYTKKQQINDELDKIHNGMVEDFATLNALTAYNPDYPNLKCTYCGKEIYCDDIGNLGVKLTCDCSGHNKPNFYVAIDNYKQYHKITEHRNKLIESKYDYDSSLKDLNSNISKQEKQSKIGVMLGFMRLTLT